MVVTEFLSYPSEKRIRDVLEDLQTNHEEYRNYHVQYFYVTDKEEKLVGVLRMP